MNPFVFACISPHGGEIIPELKGKNPNRMAVTRNSLIRIGENMEKAMPDVLIVLTPHGTRINGQFSISASERMVGTVEENDSSYTMERVVDKEFARRIADEAILAGIPTGTINYGTSSGPISCLPLDWGAIVPLRFMPDVPIIVITPSRDISYETHLEFGKALGRAVHASQKRVGLIASCDWSHAHDEAGPYGYDPAAKMLDEEVVIMIKQNQLEKMAEFDDDFVEAAKPDGIWQTLMLAGAIPQEGRRIEFLSYEAPTYFGLLCAIII
ncbi:extradiol ring-cleavage dioxygenase [Psychrobacillus glaciei]|uniref:Extradiol ring-cleavage dioxygenase n=1 Tax=Psychrobacillus glaciei TaxID=2283160 RepID=A0A5J6SKJ6_9BACI|nr:extradiol ring-cleavage dioxygenase [Psychrobacillus glaciei]QFF98408.1 extradiol ring-cleavage dioxygenase [Psychrobacillus glaciei]